MKSIEVGVDELTVVLQPSDNIGDLAWDAQYEAMLARFVALSSLEDLFGPLSPAMYGIMQGYSQGLTIENRPWHFGIYWHDDYPSMGLCVKFSAWAWAAYTAEYEAQYGVEMNAAVFLRMVQDNIYTARVSRIDLTADYFDYPCPLNQLDYLSPDTLYRGLERGSYEVRYDDSLGRTRRMAVSSALNDHGSFETFYIGGRKGKTTSFLRVYNKRNEQIQTKGPQYDRAILSRSWVRFEAVFKHQYAHQVGEALLGLTSSADLSQYIASVILGKYMFFDATTDDPMEISEDLAAISQGQVAALSRQKARDNDLLKSVDHLRYRSGLYATLYKAFMVWGDFADIQLLNYLRVDYLSDFKPKVESGLYKTMAQDLHQWICKHKAELSSVPLKDYLPKLDIGDDIFEPQTGQDTAPT